jgi:hypothetical protein
MSRISFDTIALLSQRWHTVIGTRIIGRAGSARNQGSEQTGCWQRRVHALFGDRTSLVRRARAGSFGASHATMSIPRILGVGAGLVFGFFALLFLLFSMGIYLNEPGVPHRKLNCVIASVPFLITVGIVFSCFSSDELGMGKALLYTFLAELCLAVLTALFVFWLFWSLERSSPNQPAPNGGPATQLGNSGVTEEPDR